MTPTHQNQIKTPAQCVWAHPGTLPTVNKEAVKNMMIVGRAVGGELATYSEFDRKNYFYPDIPKAYQLSQYQFPFVKGGELNGVQLNRVHLEEDTGKSQHADGHSLVDFNRAGVPLMELVTEPVIHNAEQAGQFVRELQLLLKTIGVSDANMEKGEMRVEANISVSANEQISSEYTEVKNLNSFKAMESAIDYEIKRQSELRDRGEKVVKETRGWDDNKGKTFSQRTKESADDYRYFPDPDIPKIDRSKIPEFNESRIDEITPKTPTFKRDNYKYLGLADNIIEVVISDPSRDTLFNNLLEAVNDNVDAKLIANYVTSDLTSLVDESGKQFSDLHITTIASALNLLSEQKITSRVAKDLLTEFSFENADLALVADDRGLIQSDSADDLLPLVEQVIAENTAAVEEYRSGKEQAVKFLVGQGMKLSRGAANPQVLEKLLIEKMS